MKNQPPRKMVANAGHDQAGLSTRAITRVTLILLAIGLAWRATRYFLRFPIWGDEAMLAQNFAWYDYWQLTQRLDNCQVAPILFLWAERFIYGWLGCSELAMRLVPFVAGIASLALFWRLASRVLDPLPRMFAVAFLAVAIWPVSMCSLLKPYSCDLLMSLALLFCANEWMRNRQATHWLVLLALFVPVALLCSNPTIFVAGAVSTALLFPVWQSGWKSKFWFAAYNLAMMASFLIACQIGKNQLDTPMAEGTTKLGMTNYWANAFPPAHPLEFLRWLVLGTAGQMAAYPVGDNKGGSILTVICCAIGVRYLVQNKRWHLLVLLLTPVLLNLIASALRRYPYGASGRLSQHLAPTVCLLAGLGVCVLIQRPAWSIERRAKWSLAVAGLFALLGIGGIVRDVIYPYRLMNYQWMRSTTMDIRSQIPANDAVVLCGDPRTMEPTLVWYWLNAGDSVRWNFQLPAGDLDCERIWGVYFGDNDSTARERLEQAMQSADPNWRMVSRTPYHYAPRTRKEPPIQYQLYCFERPALPMASRPKSATHK